MPDEMQGEEEIADVDYVDVRHAEVVWSDTDARPRPTYGGCSVAEAIGLLILGAVELVLDELGVLPEEDEDDA